MYQRLLYCPLCESGHFHNKMVAKDAMLTQESFTICECSECGLLFTNPRPDKDNLPNYYNSEDYISHSNTSSGFTAQLYKLARIFTLRQKVSWINAINPKKGRLLDFGAGMGHFLVEAKKDGWDITGFEPNRNANIQAKQINHIKHHTNIEDLKNEKKFDVITLFHVLEHISDLDETLQVLLSLLKKRGRLVFAVPNLDSVDFKHYKEKWAALDVPRHLYHFNKKSITYLADKYHLKVVQTIPMKLDTYYVSMLSDKYQGQKNIIKSFLRGYSLNQKARKNTDAYASIVYILKKK